jgi:hypothetical protein
MPATQTANDRIATYLAAPSLDAWKALRTMLIPGTGRTLWQAWVSVDGSATTSAAAPQFPCEFALRRAVKAANNGKVPFGLGALIEANRKAPCA